MSRSGYVDDWDMETFLYRGRVTRAMRGKRGQAFLRELAKVMDAMPVKELIESRLIDESGACCAIGAVCKARDLDVTGVHPEEADRVAALVDIAESMAREIVYLNDECGRVFDEETRRFRSETPSERWIRMRRWVEENLIREVQAS